MSRVCFEIDINGFPIRLILTHEDPEGQDGYDRLFSVHYGLQQKGCLYEGQAARELGACIMHALACEGKLRFE